ncbi:ROK family transcriptional regulator [Alkalicoccus luteus]|uniref:ROK family transcriptional regulator n=1 Tax=Alkalicoccus luteus TaxID=1237094 RepID=UPI0040348033
MKSMNRSTVLNIVRLEGPISRADIAKRTKLTPPTVGTIVQELKEEGILLEEQGIGKVQGGRKPLMLTVNAEAYYAVGVYAAAEVVHTVVADLDGEIISEQKEAVRTVPTMNEFLSLLTTSVENVIQSAAIDSDKIIGIGVAMHGLINTDTGTALFSPHLQLRNIPIKSHLEAKLHLPVLVENDVRTLTLAESWFGQGKDASHYLCVSVGLGIGSGIVLDNTIYHGPVHSAGEIGHTVVEINGPKCRCGNYGCLEAFASETAIINQVTRQLRLGKSSSLQDKSGSDELTMADIYEAAADGDALTAEILADAGRYLGIAIANITNMMSFTKVIVEGDLFQVGNVILSPLRETVEKRTIQADLQGSDITVSKLGKKGMVIGAFTLAIDQLFQAGSIPEKAAGS